MKFQMDRNSGLVTFKGLIPQSKVKVIWPDNDVATVEDSGDGEVTISFNEARKKFLRQIINIEIIHKEYETVKISAEIRFTKLIPQQFTTQIKKG